MTNSPYETSFSLKTLDHLGINLYGNAPAVIAELIANSHDAGATRVDITISPGKIVVQDNGSGMSLDDINTKYLRFGYEKRRDITTISMTDGEREIQRHVMGRKGIGKISALSIAGEVEVQTVCGSERNGFIISLDIIRQLQENNSTQYLPAPLPADAISINQGTRIELRNLVDEVTGLDNTLRESLARMFPNTGSEVLFDIYVNNSPLTIDDRKWFKRIQFMWYFGEDSRKFTAYCPSLEQSFLVDHVVDMTRGYTISGWLATTILPSDVPIEQKIVPVYAQNKMIQRDLLYDYKNYKISSSYLIGEVYASFMDVDTEPDIILSDRQRINPNDPRYVVLRQHVVNQVEAIDKAWDLLREKSPNRRPRKKKGETTPSPPSPPNQPNPSNSSSPVADDPAPIQQPSVDMSGASGLGDNNGDNTTNAESSTATQNNQTDTGGEAGQGERLRPPPPPPREAQVTFSNIRSSLKASTLEQGLKEIMLYDLEQAQAAYNCQGYKACVAMLGAVLEGVMLATLRRPEIMEVILSDPNPPEQVKQRLKGLGSPIYNDRTVFAERLGGRLTFDDYRLLLEKHVPSLQHLGVVGVQHFRNAIHPWQALQNPGVYRTYSFGRALQHLTAVEIIINAILSWTP